MFSVGFSVLPLYSAGKTCESGDTISEYMGSSDPDRWELFKELNNADPDCDHISDVDEIMAGNKYYDIEHAELANMANKVKSGEMTADEAINAHNNGTLDDEDSDSDNNDDSNNDGDSNNGNDVDYDPNYDNDSNNENTGPPTEVALLGNSADPAKTESDENEPIPAGKATGEEVAEAFEEIADARPSTPAKAIPANKLDLSIWQKIVAMFTK